MNIFLIILAELLFIGLLIMYLFKIKSKFGLAPLCIFLGSIQFLQTILATTFYIKAFNQYSFSPGAVILFTSSLMAILLVYIKDGVSNARVIIWGIILANVTFVIIAKITSFQVQALQPYLLPTNISMDLFKLNARVFFVGTVVLILDGFLIVIIYEFLFSKVKVFSMFLRILIALTGVLIFDAIVFGYGYAFDHPNVLNIITGQLFAKIPVAVFYSVVLYLYLRYFDKSNTTSSANNDIFSIITYRGKYESLKTEKEKNEEKLHATIIQQSAEIKEALNRFKFLSINQNPSIEQTVEQFLNSYIVTIKEAFKVDACIVRLLEKNNLKLAASVGVDKNLLPAVLEFNTKHTSKVFSQRITYMQNTHKNKEEEQYKLKNNIQYNYKTYVGLPLYTAKANFGILGLFMDTRNRVFSELELEQLAIISNQISQSFQNIYLFNQNEKQKEILVRQIVAKKEADKKTKESEQHLKTILETEPECIKMLDIKGYLIDMNPAGLQMIEADNLEMVKDQSVLNIIDEPYRNSFRSLNQSIFKGNSGKLEFEITGLKGTKRWLETHAVPFKNASGEIIALLGVTRDISDKKKAEKELQESEEKYKLLFFKNPLPLWIIDKETHCFLDVNEAAITLYGYSKNEFLKLKATQIRPNDEVNKYLESMKDASVNRKVSGPWTHILQNGTQIKTEITAENIQYNNKLCRLIAINNITEKLKTQKLLEETTQQLRELASHLQNIREEERKDIAREIHDELGQQLTGLKMDVFWLKKNVLKDDPKAEKKLSEILLLIDATVQTVRSISAKLRPNVLDNLGLIAAIEWLRQDFLKRTRILVHFKSSFNEKNINPTISIGLYRIVQESLNNIAKYAQAKSVSISLEEIEQHIHLTIQDDGIGFDVNHEKKEKSFGLLGIKERCIMMNGSYELFTEPNKGTEIFVKIPIQVNSNK